MERQPWWRGTRGEWYVVAQGVLFLLIALGPKSLPGTSEWPAPWNLVGPGVGLVLSAAGAALALAGLSSLGSRNLTALPYPKDSAQLVRTGAYRVVRHPIYGGLILMSFGWGLLRQGWLTLVFAAALFVLFDFKSRKEERWLLERFPEYRAYCGHVKKLLPWVY